MMEYQSTRNPDLHATAAQAVLQGLAPDGGLYTMPSLAEIKLDWQALLPLDTLSMAREILSALLPSFDKKEMDALVHAAYANKFETPDLTPTVAVGDDAVLELFRGPTSAFKDVALSMLPRLMTAAREKCGVSDEILILTACPPPTPSISAVWHRRWCTISAPTPIFAARAASKRATRWISPYPPATSVTFWRAISPVSWGFPWDGWSAPATPTTC